jgi:hypothetical protein
MATAGGFCWKLLVAAGGFCWQLLAAYAEGQEQTQVTMSFGCLTCRLVE